VLQIAAALAVVGIAVMMWPTGIDEQQPKSARGSAMAAMSGSPAAAPADVTAPNVTTGQAAGIGGIDPQAAARLVSSFRARLLELLPGVQADGHATEAIEGLLAELQKSLLPAASTQQLLWELALANDRQAVRRLIYDMIERVGSTFIAQRIVEHFDAIPDPAERSRVLQLLARGLEVRGSDLPDATTSAALERNTERVAELLGRLLSTPGQSPQLLGTTLDLVPEVVPPTQALQWLTQAYRQGALAPTPFYDAAVRVVFSEPEQTALHANSVLQSLAREPEAVRDAVNPKLYAFVAAGASLSAAERASVDQYLRLEEASLVSRAGALSTPEWIVAHNSLLQARSKLDGTPLDLVAGTTLDLAARATLINANPSALTTIDTSKLTALLRDMRAAAPGAAGAIGQSVLDASAMVEEVLQSRADRPKTASRS
jgi:hypothetical protein